MSCLGVGGVHGGGGKGGLMPVSFDSGFMPDSTGTSVGIRDGARPLCGSLTDVDATPPYSTKVWV